MLTAAVIGGAIPANAAQAAQRRRPRRRPRRNARLRRREAQP